MVLMMLLKVMGTDLNISSFGVCHITDMLLDISPNTVVCQPIGSDLIMSIPKKGIIITIFSSTYYEIGAVYYYNYLIFRRMNYNREYILLAYTYDI